MMRKCYMCLFVMLLLISCKDNSSEIEDEQEYDGKIPGIESEIPDDDYADWGELTHSKSAPLNFDTVFNQTKVLRMDITISDRYWTAMQNDLAKNISSVPSGGGMLPGGNNGGGMFPPDGNNNDGMLPPGQGGMPGLGENEGDHITVTDFDPVWVPCTLVFNNKKWYHVGIRYKGNSSLMRAYQDNNKKLSFKLDFDEYEDDYPRISNQRFFGFKQLNLNSNFEDPSMLRDKVAADLFRAFGIPSAHTTFCALYVNGSYYGVYTLIEEVDNTVIKNQFKSNKGNLYKPEGDAAKFALGTYNESEFYPKTNEDVCDYSDVKSLYNIINSSERTTNPDQWMTELEKIFDVDVFLRWLAANTVIQNWDTYGKMEHNYYLYNNPSNNKLTWIPWDNNEAFSSEKKSLSLGLTEVTSEWPLIKYIIEQESYKTKYKAYLRQFVDEVYIASLQDQYTFYYNMLKDFVYLEEKGCTYLSYLTQFDDEIAKLKAHITTRTSDVNNFLREGL